MKKKPHPHAEKSSSVTLGAILGRIGGKESCRSRLLDGVGPRRDPAFHPTRPPSNRHRRLASPFRVKLLPPAAVGAGPGNGHPSSLRQASFRESWPNFTRSPSPISAHFPASTRFIGIHRDSSGFIRIHLINAAMIPSNQHWNQSTADPTDPSHFQSPVKSTSIPSFQWNELAYTNCFKHDGLAQEMNAITVSIANNPILIGAAAGSASSTCSLNHRREDTGKVTAFTFTWGWLKYR